MNRLSKGPSATVMLFTIAALLSSCAPGSEASTALGEFVVDASWPQPLPEKWILGLVTGVAVDSRDHIWLVHSGDALPPGATGAAQDPPIAECCVPAPPVIEFDREGNVVQTWDAVSEAYSWSSLPHGIFVDHNDYVWIGSRNHHQVLKFTRDGELVLTLGELDSVGGSNHPDRLGLPAGIWVDPATNEAYIADGYQNRRVVVYDGATGDYLRHWGAYGEPPDDQVEIGPDDPGSPPARQFSTVHGLIGSRDGLIYVADRRNNRIQAFRKNGSFVREGFVRRGTLASGSAFDVAFSADPEQRFLYVADGTNHKVWILQRENLEVVGEFGRGGRQAGELLRPHNMAVDSEGNIFIGEAENTRVQRFVPQ